MQLQRSRRMLILSLCGEWAGMAVLILAFLSMAGPRAEGAEPKSSAVCLVVVFDGLRPDYITPELMPSLHALSQQGAVGLEHHSVFPTVTRVNATSLATGTSPAVHGVLYNEIFLPEILPDTNINTGDGKILLQVEERSNGQLLTAPSLGELLDQAGKRVFVTTSSSTGAAYLLNHKVLGDGIWNSNRFVLPITAQERAVEQIGPFPDDSGDRSRWAVDGCLHALSSETPPAVTFLWLTDVDGAGHRYGVGAPQTLAAIRHVDAEFGRLLTRLDERGQRERVNIFVTTDHGFSTYTGEFQIARLLAQHNLAAQVRIVGGRQIYVHDHNENTIRKVVDVLQQTAWVGAIFTRAARPDSPEGFVPGTLSFDSISWNHPRAADILVDTNWTDEINPHGYRGTTTSSGGTAGHGSSSPFDIRIRLIADGPDIRRGVMSSVPTGNIDIAPTICFLQGIEQPESMRGRVLKELLRGGPAAESVPIQRQVHHVSASQSGRRYDLELKTSQVEQTIYIDGTQAKRTGTDQP